MTWLEEKAFGVSVKKKTSNSIVQTVLGSVTTSWGNANKEKEQTRRKKIAKQMKGREKERKNPAWTSNQNDLKAWDWGKYWHVAQTRLYAFRNISIWI